MSGLRDYEAWHREYDDPTSDLSWRLDRVQAWLRQALDARAGPTRVLSACSGDGRDIIDVLAERDDADRVEAFLLELHPRIAQRAREAARAAALRHVEVRTADAGVTDAYVGAAPANIVLLVGIFGNISEADLARTIATAPAFCRPGATVIWSRGLNGDDLNDRVRAWFGHAGFSELDYVELGRGSRPALGAARYDWPPQPLQPGRQLFTFRR